MNGRISIWPSFLPTVELPPDGAGRHKCLELHGWLSGSAYARIAYDREQEAAEREFGDWADKVPEGTKVRG